MIDSKKVLALIPARGGSKGLPGKNIRPLGGKPMLAWSVEAARASAYVDRVILSTDDPAIMDAGRASGAEVPFIRPPALATDTATTLDVVLHALETAGQDTDYLVLLQPTSPLRTGADIDACITLTHRWNAPGAVSVCPAKPPQWMYHVDPDGRGLPVLGRTEGGQRQSLPPAYLLNGAVYVVDIARFRANPAFITPDTRFHLMPPERSVDIDTALDFAWAELLLSRA